MSHPGTNSRDIFMDAGRGFEDAGFDVVYWELEPLQRMAGRAPAGVVREGIASDISDQFGRFVRANRIDCSVALWANGLLTLPIGHNQGKLVSSFDVHGHDHVSFWLDAPHWAHGGAVAPLFNSPVVASPRLHSVINNRATADEMGRVLGFGRVLARPYGIDPRVFSPREDVSPRFDLVFGSGVDDPEPTAFELAELERGEPDMDAIRAARAETTRADVVETARNWKWPAGVDGEGVVTLAGRLVDIQVDRPGTPMLDRIGCAVEEDASLDGPAKALVGHAGRFIEITKKVRAVERSRRAFTIAYLSRHLRCAVFGQGDFDGWPVQAERLGYVPYDKMSDAYAAGRLGLNVMRWQDEIGMNLKTLEVSASGRLCLCDRREGLSDMFRLGEEVADFGSPAEALSLARELVADDARRGRMQTAALERVRSEHTWAHWARDVVAWVHGYREA